MEQAIETYTEDSVSLKKEMISVRIHPESRMRIGEVARRFGVPMSSVVNMCVNRFFSEIYDREGNMLPIMSLSVRQSIRMEDGYYPLAILSKAFGVSKDSMSKRVSRHRVRCFKVGRESYLSYNDIARIYGEDKRGEER